MNAHPKLSVVMTTYNAERYIEEAVQSILNQSFSDFEFIIVDNDSQDETSLRMLSFHDPRIIFIQNNRNMGQTKALNIGIGKSQTRYIARMDADDVAEPERLAIQYEFLENHPDIALVGTAWQYIDQNGKSLRRVKVPTDPLTIRCYLLASGDLTSWCVGHPTVMMRKSALEEVGLYNEQESFDGYPQDYALWRVLSAKYSFANVDRPLLKYRILKNSESRKFFDKSCEYRYNITLKYITSCLTNFNEYERISLANMLEYRSQGSKKDGENIFEIFDRYFDVSAGKFGALDKTKNFRNQMKLYYLPKLFLTNKCLSLKEFIGLVVHYPVYLFDIKFYRKVIKVMLQSLLLQRFKNS